MTTPPRLGRYGNKKGAEKITLYDKKGFVYPFYNVEGFTKKSTKTYKMLEEILKNPIKGFVLEVSYSHLHKRRKSASLDVMDYILPYFENAESIRCYLASSVCLVITEFAGAMGMWDSIGKHKNKACDWLRESMQVCYTKFHEASKEDGAYGRLAKQKAFYDIFLEKPNRIRPNEEGDFDLNEFQLNFEKVILFDAKESVDSLHVGESRRADTRAIRGAVENFKGISPAALNYHESSRSGLYLVGTISLVGSVVGYRLYQASKVGSQRENKKKE